MLSVNRLDRAKRIDLLLEAATLEPGFRIVVAGDGPDRERLERLAPNGRVEFAGRVDDERLADLYARCLAVFYAPFDEDYGMVPFEAFLSEKPVVTTTDAGGPLEIVPDRETGVVVEPEPTRVAEACAYLVGHEDEAHAWGRAGKTSPSACPGTTASRRSWRPGREGRLLLPDAAVAVGDRGLLGAAAARAARARRASRS